MSLGTKAGGPLGSSIGKPRHRKSVFEANVDSVGGLQTRLIPLEFAGALGMKPSAKFLGRRLNGNP
jgi:hypothetical protein